MINMQKKYMVLFFIIFQIINIYGEENIKYREYQIKFGNNEMGKFNFLSNDCVNKQLSKNSWILIQQTKGHFWKYFVSDNGFLVVLNNGNGILTDNKYVFEMVRNNNLIIFDGMDITNISFYYIISDEKLSDFIESNIMKKINLFFENTDPKYTEYYELNDGRYLELIVDNKIGFVFMNKAANCGPCPQAASPPPCPGLR
jgi:hypothetical protein